MPIDVVALRTGDLTDGLAVEDYTLHFAELEAQYAILRARMLGRLAEVAVRFYDTLVLDGKGNAQPATPVAQPRAPLLRRLDTFRYLRGTVGEFYEAHYDQHTEASAYSVGLNANYALHLLAVHRLVRLEYQFATELQSLDITAAEAALLGLQQGGRFFGRLGALTLNDAVSGGPAGNAYVDGEELSDQLDELVTAGDLDALRALHANYQQRREEVLRRQLFSSFQEDHPGLQFKAGTETGGTFIIVYHGAGGRSGGPVRTGRFRIAGQVLLDGQGAVGTTITAVGSAFGTATDFDGNFSLRVNSLPSRLSVSMVGTPTREIVVSDDEPFLTIDLGDDTPADEETAIPGIDIGTVVADFYLPYRCCGKTAPIHIFPPQAPTEPVEDLTAFLEQVGCTEPALRAGPDQAPFVLTIAGGTPPYFIRDDNGNELPVPTAAEVLANGLVFTVFDSGDPVDEVELTVTTLPALDIQLTGSPRCADDNQTFSQDFTIVGGRPPYEFTQPDESTETITGSGTVTGIASGSSFVLEVSDSFPEACTAEREVPAHTCEVDEPDCGLPCDGIAIRQSYPLWAQRPLDDSHAYLEFMLRMDRMMLTAADGSQVALSDNELTQLNLNIREAIGRSGNLDENSYPTTMQRVIEVISTAIDRLNNRIGLPNDEPALQVTLVTGEIDRLEVEFFECLPFELSFSLDYFEAQRRSQTQLRYQRQLTYNNDGARPGNENIPFPSFDRFRIDRCDPDAAAEPLCNDDLGIGIRQESDGAQRTFTLQGNRRGHPVWYEFPLGEPGLSLSDPTTVEYANDGIETLAKALMVDPQTGCFAVTTSDVNI